MAGVPEHLQELLDFDAGAVGGISSRVRAVPEGATGVCTVDEGCISVEDFAGQPEGRVDRQVGGARKRKTRRRRTRRSRSGTRRSVRVRINVRWPARQRHHR